MTNENAAVIDAGDDSTVTFGAVVVANTGGTIEAVGTDATIVFEGTTIDGGTLASSGVDSVIRAASGTRTPVRRDHDGTPSYRRCRERSSIWKRSPRSTAR